LIAMASGEMRFRINQPIIAVTPDNGVRKQLELFFGVYPTCIDYLREGERILSTARILLSEGLVRDADTVLFTAATRTAKPHSTNLIEIHNIQEFTQQTRR
jgi:pyruvate kinase